MRDNAPPVSFSDSILRTVGHCRLLPFGIRYRVVNIFRSTDRVPDRRFSVPFFGLTYKGSLACDIDRRVFFFGAYEPEILNFFRRVLVKMDSPVVADIGANVGHHSLYLSKFAGQVHSFEPWSKVSDQLLRHLKDNNIRNVKVHKVALGSMNETKLYYAPEGGNSGTGSFLSSHATDRNRPSAQLPVVNGDDYFQENGISRLDLLKIDVEGWEWFVLLGLVKTIQRCRPIVVFEYSASTKRSLQGRSQLNIFPEYKVFSLGSRIQSIDGEMLSIGNILLMPAEKVDLLRNRP
jgi:FkbM family methyltransferase